MSKDLKIYFENMEKPWGNLFYQIVWEQLPSVNNAKILDFGSGFGITANHLAKNNHVVAIEPNSEMVEMSVQENTYQQIIGSLAQLKQQKDRSFDLIICHNVLEYTLERKEIVKEFYRVLKPNEVISIVKHNHIGRIMQKVVFENNIDEALSLLDGASIQALNFGQVHYYEWKDINGWIKDLHIKKENVFGVRTFWGLQQNNEVKYDPTWQEKMFQMEMRVSNTEEFKKISFYHHYLLKKV
ncbi:class I SAM-dependent methyltransferase [Niallia sp. JL1B1071]|uniref:class I SAM-dependent methyltransferase n=1 Tax=Niallia tiangongensis TaxID=3237105 RepID=UPI0037DC8854